MCVCVCVCPLVHPFVVYIQACVYLKYFGYVSVVVKEKNNKKKMMMIMMMNKWNMNALKYNYIF